MAVPQADESTTHYKTVCTPLSPMPVKAAEALVARLVEEMAQRWRQDERPTAEDYLAGYPELGDEPDAAVQLIYEEFCLRQEHGQEVRPEDVLAHFPRWQAQLQALFDCHQLLQPEPDPSGLPQLGAMLGEYRLLAQLGTGAQGTVFLATQPSLADRPVVLKITPCEGGEHLSLARLQHTHIVPLYTVQDDLERNLRVLCMPYFGSANLAWLLKEIHNQPLEQRTGQRLLAALDSAQAKLPVNLVPRGPARKFLAQASYVQAVCWIGACLADALQYAHERNLVHLDLKPSNVLIAVDGQPMLLDFHLAREPIRADAPRPSWMGGTPSYMSPEQRAAMAAVRENRKITAAVDARSDVYSLGLVLYEALAGKLLKATNSLPPPLNQWNPQVSVGLADVLRKCLEPQARDRYPDAAALAADLRRHLTDLPLQGVANRSWRERWGKWRRRRPHALALTGLLIGLLVAAGTLAAFTLTHTRQRVRQAETALTEGQQRLDKHEYAEAVRTLTHGLTLIENVPGQDGLTHELEARLRSARRGQAAQDLHRVADHIRFLFDVASLPPAELRTLETRCRAIWNARDGLVDRSAKDLAPESLQQIQTDLLDLAILWTELHVRLEEETQVARARREALQVLAEAEELFGANSVLCHQRQIHASALGQEDLACAAARQAARLTPQTCWEFYALGRSLLRSGDLEAAAGAFEQAVDLQPQAFWPNFYQGLCAFRRQHHQNAVQAFSICVALAPRVAPCYYNRALAHAALDDVDRAIQDYDRALKLHPGLAAAALNRGILHYQEKRYVEAITDLQLALEKGTDPATVHYNLALAHLARQDRSASLASVQRALRCKPTDKQARELYDLLQRER